MMAPTMLHTLYFALLSYFLRILTHIIASEIILDLVDDATVQTINWLIKTANTNTVYCIQRLL